MIKKVADKVFKIVANSNIFILLLDEPIIIDAGDRKFHDQVQKDLKEIIDPAEVKTVILTHLHYDHIGCVDLFPNAKIYVSQEEIDTYKNDAFGTILFDDIVEKFDVELNPLPKAIGPLEVIKSPGHTSGSVCLYYPEKKIMFSGDTIFYSNGMGRIDLPTSVPEAMTASINKVSEYDYEILCPGHDY